MIDLNDNRTVAELARQQSIETKSKVYAVDQASMNAVYINGAMRRWAYIDDIEVIYSDDDAPKWEQIFHGARH